jgi:16S rRNA (cytosine967-C5)-methyltransferase
MEQNNEPPESAVRANGLLLTASEVVSLLAREGIASRTDSMVEEAVVLERPYDVHGSPLFRRGLVMPQSRASMLVAHVLDPQPGERVLDLCAAPGAKTTHIAARMRNEGAIVAVDLDERRLQAVASNCARLHVTCVDVRKGDARSRDYGSGFDRVLVDPPCSDLGTLQSRPDARWRKTRNGLAALERVQGEILAAGAAALRPGGTLVYSTCTITEAENQRQIARFLAAHEAFSPVDRPHPYPLATAAGSAGLQTLPHRDATDGFFIVPLERKSSR